MKATLAIVILIALQSVGAQTNPSKETVSSDRPPTLSKEFQEAGQLAYEAIERLGDYNDKPETSYEPRRLDAEKATSEARRKAKTAEDKHASEVLENWLSGLSGQRQFMPGDGRVSNAAMLGAAYGDKSKQSREAHMREAKAETNHILEEFKKSLDSISKGGPPLPKTPLGPMRGLDYWERSIFPCAVEASWYFGETLTKEGIETAQKSTCAPDSKPK
jgi:hypothetical protein